MQTVSDGQNLGSLFCLGMAVGICMLDATGNRGARESYHINLGNVAIEIHFHVGLYVRRVPSFTVDAATLSVPY